MYPIFEITSEEALILREAKRQIQKGIVAVWLCDAVCVAINDLGLDEPEVKFRILQEKISKSLCGAVFLSGYFLELYGRFNVREYRTLRIIWAEKLLNANGYSCE